MRTPFAPLMFVFAAALCPSLIVAAEPASAPIDGLRLADPVLDNCVHAYAKQQGYQTIAQVKEIPCFGLGIASIAGLEQFTEALVIDLSRNNIHDFQPLYALNERLGYIDIHDNPLSCTQMIVLAQRLKRAFRIGFDPATCTQEPAPQPPQSPELPPQPPQSPELPPQPLPPQLPGHPLPPDQPGHPLPPDLPGQPQPGRLPSGVTYEQAAAELAMTCGPCHQNGRHKGGIRLDTEADLLRYSSSILDSIQRGYMPPRSRDWRQSAAGQLVVSYLQSLPSQTGAGHRPEGREHEHEHEEEDDD